MSEDTATIAVLLRGALGCSHREAKELVLAGRALRDRDAAAP